MKSGMTVIKSAEIPGGYIFLGFLDDLQEKEWATYYSQDCDPKNTIWGKYFTSSEEAEANFKFRVERGF